MPTKKSTIPIHGVLAFPWSSRRVYKPSICFSSSSPIPYRNRNIYRKNNAIKMRCLRENLSSRHKSQNRPPVYAWPVRAVRVDKDRFPLWTWAERPKESNWRLYGDPTAEDQKTYLHCIWSKESLDGPTYPSIWKSETRSLWKGISNASIVHLLLNGVIRTSMFRKQPPKFTP